MNAVVASVRRATPGTRVVRVRPGRVPFHFRAGQAVEIGPADARTLTPYSIASAPEDTARDGLVELLVKVDAAGRWGDDFEPLHRGQPLRLRGPFGRFTFPDSATEDHFLFIAGGTGIAPLRSMIRHGRTFSHSVFRLLYSARTPDDFAYRRELCGMARRDEIEVMLTATRDVPANWRGGRGRITRAQLERLIDSPATRCFVCGPVSMVDEVPPMLGELGIDKSRIHVEEWGA